MGANESNSRWIPVKADAKDEKRATRSQKDAIKEVTEWAKTITIPKNFDSKEWRTYFEGQLKGRMGSDVSLASRRSHLNRLKREGVVKVEYVDDESAIARMRLLQAGKVSDATKQKIRDVNATVEAYMCAETGPTICDEIWFEMIADEVFYEVHPRSGDEKKLNPTLEYNDQIASHLLDLMRARVVTRPNGAEGGFENALDLDDDDDAKISLAFDIHPLLTKAANKELRRRSEGERREFKSKSKEMSLLLPDLDKIVDQFVQNDMHVNDINEQLGRGELTAQEMTAFVVFLWHCAFAPISDPFSPERIAITGKKGTGTKKRTKTGQFCGCKGKVCGGVGCDLCWVWLEEADDCTLKVNPELMSKLASKDRKEIESMNSAISVLHKQQKADKIDSKLDQAIAVLQCDLAITVEDALSGMGMEKAAPSGMMDKIGKFARAKSADDTVVVLSNTLRKSMTEKQLAEFKQVNREHKAIQIAYEKPKEALPEIRLCTYLLLYAYAHQNGFDFSQKAEWTATTAKKENKKKTPETGRKKKQNKKIWN